ncbi:anthranilate synthase alpha subunit 2, chloroplastic-like protein isoform X1 [Tanacetum coccineum]
MIVVAVVVAVDHSVKFKEAAKHGNLIPLYRSIFSDHLTPVLAYRCLVKEDERDAPSFLFESVEPGLKASNVGMYSVMELSLQRKMWQKIENVYSNGSPKDGKTESGWVGYFSYDTVRYVETRKLPFSNAPQDDRNLPDVHLGLYDDVIVFDHVEKKAYVIHWVRMDQYSSVDEAFKDGTERLETLLSRVHDIKSSMTTEAYKEAVLQAKEHILAGDIFQIVLSQRFERRTFADPFEVYRALRIVNPSPYMTYLQARGSILVASSPEILTRVKKTPKEDYMLENQLLHDEKQCAEHIMLVDLGRNDVGKVTGELLDELSTWDALRAALPVGTVSGAPKVKAMELIDKLEVTRRGPYSGGFGGISFTGDMDIALALRTIVFPTASRYDTMYSYRDSNKRRDWVAHLQAGAGIVADSDPGDEQRECENKAAALARAIDLAESSFVDK